MFWGRVSKLHDMPLLELQFGRVLDGDECALLRG